MLETQVGSLIQEDPICQGVTKSMCHNYKTCALGTENRYYKAHVSLWGRGMFIRIPSPEKAEAPRAAEDVPDLSQ